MTRPAIKKQENSFIERMPHDSDHPFIIINKKLVERRDISAACRLLIIYLIGKPIGWKVNVQHLINNFDDSCGRDKIFSLINEAIKHGYISRTVVRDEKTGQFSKTIYKIYENPIATQDMNSNSSYEAPKSANACDSSGIQINMLVPDNQDAALTKSSELNKCFESSEFKECLPRPCLPDQASSDVDSSASHIYIVSNENIVSINPISPLTDLPNFEHSASPLATDVAQCGSVVSRDSGIIPKKPKKIKTVISPEIRAVTNDLVAVIREEMPTVKLASDAVLAETVRKLIDDDHRCPLNAQRVLKFAINDRREGEWPGWAKFMRNANPIAYMRIKFDAMNEAMTNVIKKPVNTRVVTDAQGVAVKSKGRF